MRIPRFPSAERIISSLWAEAGNVENLTASASRFSRSGRGFASRSARMVGGTARGVDRATSNPLFVVPALAAIVAMGASAGFSKKILNSQEGQDFLQLYSPQGTTDSTRRPLGYSSETNPYSYGPSIGGDLGATGELALALFKTRHGR